ncbi:homoserine dehydrogenase [Pullulanibacillus sp. KACC 23026]|uniref:homoserine dehydrogenase n=1 Tax=Pullulanibacillus sp. KACC 23026 TaxID=3028315 RepID=UPI0023B07E53|nr:homoserine dehydrogenase [Pullulanibacillus sp. KACC 23026]WEG13762.1 homoserine dehydrogenase [Pullulanibacillus sp. KACC 23026]
MAINICLLGFGTVGSSVYNLIQTRKEALRELLGDDLSITHLVIKDTGQKRDIDESVQLSIDFLSAIKSGTIDLVIEAIVGVEPAFTYIKSALEHGIPVITANKEMFAERGVVLRQLAKENQTVIGYEATVAGGIPIIRTITDLLHVNKVSRIEGILNGTSNFILTDMRSHLHSFKKSLKAAQDLGYAEADPTSDIKGYDAFYKLMILCQDVFGKQPNREEVTRIGIEGLTSEDLHEAAKKGGRMKLVAEAFIDDSGRIHASITPKFIDKSHPLYGVEGVENAVTVHTDLLGALTLKGPGAGGMPTASAILEDITRISLQMPLKSKRLQKIKQVQQAAEAEVSL